MSGCGKPPEEQQKQAEQLSNQADELWNQRRYREAISTLYDLTSVYLSLKRDSALAETHHRLADIYREIGKFDSAAIEYFTAIEHSKTGVYRTLEQQAKLSLANLFVQLGRYSDAASLAQEVELAAEFAGDNDNLYQALLILSKAFHGLAQYDEELKKLRILEVLTSTLNNSNLFEFLLERRITAYAKEGLYDSARTVFHLWMNHAKSNNDSLSLVRSMNRWGTVKYAAGEIDSAIQLLTNSLRILNFLNDDTLKLKILSSLGYLTYQRGNYSEAKRYFLEVERIAHQTGNITAEILAQLYIISTTLQLDRGLKKTLAPQLEEQCYRIKTICEERHLFNEQAFALYLMGKIAESQNHLATALKWYYKALALKEKSILSRSEGNEIYIDACNFGDALMYYNALLQIECSIGNVDSVFALAEHKVLYDIVRFFSRLPIKTTDGKLNFAIERLQFQHHLLASLANRIRDEQVSLQEQDFERLHLLCESYENTQKRIVTLEQELLSHSSNFARLFLQAPVSLKTLRDNLPPQTVLLEYIPLPNALFIIVVRSDTVYLKKITIPLNRIQTLVSGYNALIADQRLNEKDHKFNYLQAKNRLDAFSYDLYDVLVEPIVQYLKNATKVYIVLPQEFDYLPLHTLRKKGERSPNFFINQYQVNYLPTASVLLFPAQKTSLSNRIIGIGHPGRTKWDVEYELKDIWAFNRNAKLLFGTDATIEDVRALPADILHITAEIALNVRFPSTACILLSDKVSSLYFRKVPIGMMATLPKIPVVIISNITEKPGVINRYIPMLMLANGTQTFIGTMWQGERKGKKYFGEVFYTNFLLAVPPDKAYHAALSALTEDNELSSPSLWGLYYCFGK